jgi:hypothetical protein
VTVSRPGASAIGLAIEAAIGCRLADYSGGVTLITRPGEKDHETMFTDRERATFEGCGPGIGDYTSDRPDMWWTHDTITEALAEAEAV